MPSEQDLKENSKKVLNCYSINQGNGIPINTQGLAEEGLKEISYPCLILVRNNGWNDYSYYTHFTPVFFQKADISTVLSTVKIIQVKAKDLRTELPREFKELPKNEFFSRGSIKYYEELGKITGYKDLILCALNDIHFNDYSEDYFIKYEGGELLYPYMNSLFRDDYFNLEVSSNYAKSAVETLDKISLCVDTVSKMEEPNKKVMLNLLYGSVITTLESYLGDAFKFHIMNNESYFYSFLKNYKFSKEENKYNIRELGLHGDKIGQFIKNKVKETMDKIIFHRVEIVDEIYKEILNIDLPGSLLGFKDAIQKRHDIFHRNGKDREGVELEIKDNQIRSLIYSVKKFISNVEILIRAKI